MSQAKLYLTDDNNIAPFPDAVNGEFSTIDMTYEGHFEVHGDTEADTLICSSHKHNRQYSRLKQTPILNNSQRFPKRPTTAAAPVIAAKRPKLYLR